MKQEVKEKWVAALRSGDYQQGTQKLNKDGKYCCLGVLCELAVNEGICKSKEESGITYYDSASNLPPFSVKVWAGWDGESFGNPEINHYCLSDWNDKELLSFNEIADLIEKHL